MAHNQLMNFSTIDGFRSYSSITIIASDALSLISLNHGVGSEVNPESWTQLKGSR